MKKRQMTVTPKKIASAQAWPLGTAVVVTKDNGERVETCTRSEPWLLGGHTWVIMVDGIAGGYALDRVTAKAD